ncbi:hypothetical protein BGZ73_005922 [Actinomortierella ambigua]|nr:hypothetical protein BGZ73_005922 [Actinomortierella ambigua]
MFLQIVLATPPIVPYMPPVVPTVDQVPALEQRFVSPDTLHGYESTFGSKSQLPPALMSTIQSQLSYHPAMHVSQAKFEHLFE